MRVLNFQFFPHFFLFIAFSQQRRTENAPIEKRERAEKHAYLEEQHHSHRTCKQRSLGALAGGLHTSDNELPELCSPRPLSSIRTEDPEPEHQPKSSTRSRPAQPTSKARSPHPFYVKHLKTYETAITSTSTSSRFHRESKEIPR